MARDSGRRLAARIRRSASFRARRLLTKCSWAFTNQLNRLLLALPPTTSAHLPIPPTRFLEAVTGHPDARLYADSGLLAAEDIQVVLEHVGRPLTSYRHILDFGCGSGRIIRYWRDLDAMVHGCDYNPDLINWCQRHLPFHFAVNKLDPPLPYPDGMFDLVYAMSVFTHLDEQRQFAWRDELLRVLEPGGVLCVSTHGTRWLPQLEPAVRAAFQAGRFVTRGSTDVGTNSFGAYHPEVYVRDIFAAGLDVLGFFPWAGRGMGGQDLWVFGKSP